MSDYIKREDAIRTMAQYMMDMALIDNPEASDRIEQWEGSIAAPVMSTVKAADVVEVVRCKDCKWRYSTSDCTHWLPCMDIIYNHDFYCGFGERAEA